MELYLDRFQKGVPEKRRKKVSPRALELLRAYSWPGNVRELANTLERAVLMAQGEVIRAGDLFPAPRPGSEPVTEAAVAPPTLAEVERRHILRVLESTGGKKAPAARLLGISVKTLSRRLE